MNDQIIIELRGNGVVLTLYELDNDTLELLNVKANKIGETLSQLWFDPFINGLKKTRGPRDRIKRLAEYRGLLNDQNSFLEMRIKGKRRKKYTVAELTGYGQLFPMINVNLLNTSCSTQEKCTIIELIVGTGSLAKYVSECSESFKLSSFELLSFNSPVGEVYLFSLLDSRFSLEEDDFLIRAQHLIHSNHSLSK